MDRTALTAVYGRPFMRTCLDGGTRRMLEALSRAYPTLVNHDSDGAWWIGAKVSTAPAGEGRELASLPGGGWIVGNEAANGTLDVCRIDGIPAPSAERRVKAFLALLPEEITGHPDLLPLGQWLIQAAE